MHRPGAWVADFGCRALWVCVVLYSCWLDVCVWSCTAAGLFMYSCWPGPIQLLACLLVYATRCRLLRPTPQPPPPTAMPGNSLLCPSHKQAWRGCRGATPLAGCGERAAAASMLVGGICVCTNAVTHKLHGFSGGA